MTLKDQLKKLKDNWFLLLVFIVLAVFLFGGNLLSSVLYSSLNYGSSSYYDKSSYPGSSGSYAKSDGGGYAAEMAAADSRSFRAPVYNDQGFAPEVTDRKLTKTSSLSTEIKRGTFQETDEILKGIVTSTGSFVLNENVNRYGTDDPYIVGSYEIKVASQKYEGVILQLKILGDVQSFREQAQDITGYYKGLNSNLEAERSRLLKFKEMLKNAENVENQIQLADRIFNIEKTILYYEESLDAADNKVDYSTISLTIMEKQPEYAGVVVVKFSQLAKIVVESFNSLVSLLLLVLPWAIVAIIIWFVVRKLKK